MCIKPSGLGRGLNSLIPTRSQQQAPAVPNNFVTDSKLQEVIDTNEQVRQLPLGKIVPSPHQPRRNFDEKALGELAESIKEHGVFQPIIVTADGSDRWELVAGERRLRASKLADLETIPAIVRELKEQRKMELALIENLQREDLNPLEVAVAYQKLMDEFNLDLDQLSQKVGKIKSGVNNYLRMLNLRDEVKEAILSGKLSEGHARTLAGLPYEDQLEGMKRIIENKLSVRDAEKATRHTVSTKKIRNIKHDPEVRAIENELAGALGTKVEIRRHGGTGEIKIKFFSNEELREIIRKIA